MVAFTRILHRTQDDVLMHEVPTFRWGGGAGLVCSMLLALFEGCAWRHRLLCWLSADGVLRLGPGLCGSWGETDRL